MNVLIILNNAPHCKKNLLIFLYSTLLRGSLFFVFSDYEPLTLKENHTAFSSTTVATTLSSSVTGETFCPGDTVTFTALPDDAQNYRFYINGVLKQGPSSNNIFIPTGTLFNKDIITVTLEKNNDTGSASLTIIENKINDPCKIYFKGQSDALEQLTFCYGDNSLNIESYRSAVVNGTLLDSSDTRYQWMSSRDNNTWTAIIGAHQRNYNLSELTATTFFRRDVVNDLNGTTCRSESNVLRVEIEVELKEETFRQRVKPYAKRRHPKNSKLKME